MSTTTIEDQLAELRRRIGVLQALAQLGTAGDRSRVQGHLDALRRKDDAVELAAREAPEELEEKVSQLKMRLAVAEYALVADLSDDWGTFESAVEGELRSWDTYLERLQANVAAAALKTREHAELAIADVRNRRIALHGRLAEGRGAGGDGWQEQRRLVTADRDELGQMADGLSAKLK